MGAKNQIMLPGLSQHTDKLAFVGLLPNSLSLRDQCALVRNDSKYSTNTNLRDC